MGPNDVTCRRGCGPIATPQAVAEYRRQIASVRATALARNAALAQAKADRAAIVEKTL